MQENHKTFEADHRRTQDITELLSIIDRQAEQLKTKDAQIATIATLIHDRGEDREHHPTPTWERQIYETLKRMCGATNYNDLLNLRQKGDMKWARDQSCKNVP